MLIYLSGPYSGSSDQISANITAARDVAIAVWEAGHTALCPHLNTAHFEVDCRATYEDYIAGDLDLLSRCDAILMIPNWEASKGAGIEKAYAEAHGIPVHFWPEIPPKHPTELRAPRQVEAFRNLVMQMYRLHLSKNADYSPANILGTGELGVVVRLWDKIARLMNLYGFRIEMTAPAKLEAPRTPKHESIDDSFIDAAVYSVIGKLVRQGDWGK